MANVSIPAVELERLEQLLGDAVSGAFSTNPPPEDYARAVGERMISFASPDGSVIASNLQYLLQARRDADAWTDELSAKEAAIREQAAQIRGDTALPLGLYNTALHTQDQYGQLYCNRHTAYYKAKAAYYKAKE